MTTSVGARRAATEGGGIVLVVAAVSWMLSPHVSAAAEALLLVVPVTLAGLRGGRAAAGVTAALATLAYWIVLPPAGTFRIDLVEDVVALVIFSFVAFVVGGMVAWRVDALARVDAQRAALLRSVSHDLRTPLSSIRAASVELQGDQDYDDAARARLLAHIGAEAERLDHLVANVLSMARIEGGGLRPVCEPVDVVALTRGIVDRVATTAGVRLVVDAAPDVPIVAVDSLLIEQAVRNLLDNAVRVSPANAEVRVTVRRDGRTVSVSVDDAGPGVEPDNRNAIFDLFRTGEAAGFGGVGLAIAKAVIEGHGGTIEVGDSSLGGAAFTICLPIA